MLVDVYENLVKYEHMAYEENTYNSNIKEKKGRQNNVALYTRLNTRPLQCQILTVMLVCGMHTFV